MNKKEKIQTLIDEGEAFLCKSLTSNNPKFVAWNSSVIRFIEKEFGSESTDAQNIKSRNYAPNFFYSGMGKEIYTEHFENDLKITVEELKRIKEEIDENIRVDKKEIKKEPNIPPMLNVNINNSNIVNNYMTIENVRKQITENSMIGEIDTEELLKRLDEIEELQKCNLSKNEKWSKARKILEFIIDKGADIAIMYLPQILKVFS